MSEEEKAAFLDQEAKRAKRNHKIFLMSRDNGVMTPQDKNFITRIQLQQLVSATGNPNESGTDESLAEDFYYQVHSQIQGGQRQHPSQPLNNFAQTYLFQTGSRQGGMRRAHRGGDNHMQRMEQQVQRAVEVAKNKPKNKQLVIEGSLGKISFSNAKTPKPLLNIKRTESSGEVNRPGSAKIQTSVDGLSHKSALRSIEAVYETLMKMEDHDRYRPPPPMSELDSEKVVAWEAEARALNERLWKALKVMEPVGVYPVHPFITLLSYSKGMKAIQRIFRSTSPEQRTTILTLIVVSLDTLDVVRGAQVNTGDIQLNAAMREKVELFSLTVVSTLFNFMNELDLDIVAGILGIVCTRNVDIIAKSKIGVSMLTMILSRAELIKHQGGGNQQHWQNW
jgi:DNA topoisomerase 2-associated protein PAT1